MKPTLRAVERAVVAAANKMIDRRGWIIREEQHLYSSRRNALEIAIDDYRATSRAAAQRRSRAK